MGRSKPRPTRFGGNPRLSADPQQQQFEEGVSSPLVSAAAGGVSTELLGRIAQVVPRAAAINEDDDTDDERIFGQEDEAPSTPKRQTTIGSVAERRSRKRRQGAILDDDDDDSSDDLERPPEKKPPPPRRPRTRSQKRLAFEESDDDDEVLQQPLRKKKPRKSLAQKKPAKAETAAAVTPKQRKRPRPPPVAMKASISVLERPSEIKVVPTAEHCFAIVLKREFTMVKPPPLLHHLTVRTLALPTAISLARVDALEEGEPAATTPISSAVICAGKSVVELQQFNICGFRDMKQSSSADQVVDGSSLLPFIHLACCMEKGWFAAKLECQSDDNGPVVWLHIVALPAALQLCSAQALPLSRVAHAPKYQPARWIQQALLDIWRDGDESSVASSSSVISAKNVYDCVDNVQIQRWLQRQETGDPDSILTTVPGLRPTLRPYQAAAVEWMLQREQQQQNAAAAAGVDEEWKLAWMVLPSGMPLTQWEQQQQQQAASSDSLCLLFCPIVGWLASSVNEARTMTLGRTVVDESATGGILAESMGLGKTVEVLACVLANPRPHQPGEVGRETTTRQAAVAPSDHHDKGVVASRENNPHRTRSADVGDIADFGDADEDDSSIEGMNDDAKQSPATPSSPPGRDTPTAVVVTPGPATNNLADSDNDAATEEHWLDEGQTFLGSCLCGCAVDLENEKQRSESDNHHILVCCQCKEPMHMDCAGFSSKAEMKQTTRPVVFRKMFSDSSWMCYETRDTRHCPCCCRQNGEDKKISSRATLIVTPPAILDQWKLEIEKHTSLTVAVYCGVDKTTKSRSLRRMRAAQEEGANNNVMRSLHPHLLADHDIVLMTFDALMSDFGHAPDENKFMGVNSPDCHGAESNLRNRKRYRVVPSPLASIQWWRVCLDEAQRVERPAATSARMALKLETRHRWCVTGTPVGRGRLEDLYGLLLFLRFHPFSNRTFFQKALDPASPLDVAGRIQTLLGNVFWRSTKANPTVREQMGVPKQVEQKNLLRFSSIEKHFYERQLEATLAMAGDACERKQKQRKANAARKQMDMLAEHLHRLRAACCHPQVGAGGILAKTAQSKKNAAAAASTTAGTVGSRVLSMEEILVRLIDDARLKCEESQRLVGLHTNGMAALSRLQVELKQREREMGDSFMRELKKKSDDDLLVQSCELYLKSLDLAESNAKPTPILAHAVLAGNTGFISSRKVIAAGKCVLDWKVEYSPGQPTPSFWARIDFDGAGRRVTRLKVRPLSIVPQYVLEGESEDCTWDVLLPKRCAFEVSSAAVGGEFVPVAEFTCPLPGGHGTGAESWLIQDGFRTNKSKSWRIVVENCHKSKAAVTSAQPLMLYVGLEVELDEADIAVDSLQKLHVLHNAALSFSSLGQLRQTAGNDEDNFMSVAEMKKKADEMASEAKQIESLYMQVALSLHTACRDRLMQLSDTREKGEASLRQLVVAAPSRSSSDCWDSNWWDDFLVACNLYGDERQGHTVCARVQEELDQIQTGAAKGTGIISFPGFRSVSGLQAVLKSRVDGIRTGLGKKQSWVNNMANTEDGNFDVRTDRFKCPRGMHAKCMQEVASLSSNPTASEMYENSHCHVCKADWNQRGPKCRHCILGDRLIELDPDRVTLLVLNTLHTVLRGPTGSSIAKSCRERMGAQPDWADRAKLFFEILESQRREKVLAWRQWRVHLDLLNDFDELNQCKASMRLSYDGEDLTSLTSDQLNAVVLPVDVMTRYHDHAAKQAMALGELRRSKETLRYLRNQSAECQLRRLPDSNPREESSEQCAVCLNVFEQSSGDRAVLNCGHSFHASCLDQLTRAGMIDCPMRCRVRTATEDVLIASDKRRDDGSRIKRDVKGSWGTKVTKVVADLLDIKDQGEKAVLFSQWEDMLDIVAEAFQSNSVTFIRASSLAKIGSALKTFRMRECTVLMLNVKNGAEGLTILEATHVMMLEPLLNNALDSQAINRVSRIGQKRKTTVHRYIIQDTVETKIDALRVQQSSGDQAPIEDTKSTKHSIRAGGVDGGFATEDELMNLLS